jgi:hypothetical protein
MSTEQEVATWLGFALSGGLAILLPLAVWGHLRKPATLREAWLYSRPGWIVTGCTVALIVLAVGGLLTAIIAQTYPFMWGSFALVLGGATATVLYPVRFVSFDPREAMDGLSDPGEPYDAHCPSEDGSAGGQRKTRHISRLPRSESE